MQAHKLFLYLVFATAVVLMLPIQLLKPLVAYDTPKISILGEDKTPPSAIKFLSNPPTLVHENKINIEGVAEADSKVEIFINDNLVETLQTRDNPKFNTVLTLNPGGNSLSIRVVDHSGNVGEPTSKHSIHFE